MPRTFPWVRISCAGWERTTGHQPVFCPSAEFEEAANRFFARPNESMSGWEPAVNAQKRITHAIDSILRTDKTDGSIAIVSTAPSAPCCFAASLTTRSVESGTNRPTVAEITLHSLSKRGVSFMAGDRSMCSRLGNPADAERSGTPSFYPRDMGSARLHPSSCERRGRSISAVNHERSERRSSARPAGDDRDVRRVFNPLFPDSISPESGCNPYSKRSLQRRGCHQCGRWLERR